MHTLPQEFLALCRQLGDAQKRCSATVAAQAAQIEALQAEVVRLRGAVMLRDTRLAAAHDALDRARAAAPGLPRRLAMARHIGMLVDRIATLSRECLRWQLAAQAKAGALTDGRAAGQGSRIAAATAPHATPGTHGPGQADTAPPPDTAPPDAALDAHLAAADLVICQTGCISHDEYWRVQDHCRRTGKPCILVDQPLAARGPEALAGVRPMVVLRMARAPRPAQDDSTPVQAPVLNENGLF